MAKGNGQREYQDYFVKHAKTELTNRAMGTPQTFFGTQ